MLQRVAGRAVVAPILVTGVVACVVTLVLGAQPLATAQGLWQGFAATPYTLGQSLTITGVLALTGLAAAVPFTARLWNIGGEGQLYVGAIGAISVGLELPAITPGALAAVLMLVAGAAFGCLWGLIPGLLCAYAGASEMIVSLLLNFVGVLAALYVTRSVFPDSTGQTTRSIPGDFRLPVIWEAGGLDAGLVLALVVVLLLAMLLRKGRFGYRIRAAGAGPDAAKLAGLDVNRMTLSVFAIGGSAAGLAGALLIFVAGGQLSGGLSASYGFLGVAVALVAGLRLVWVPPAALLLAALTVSSNSLEVTAGIPRALGTVLITTLVLTLLATGAIGANRSVAR